MKPADPRIPTINGGSSSIKFALFTAGFGRRPSSLLKADQFLAIVQAGISAPQTEKETA